MSDFTVGIKLTADGKQLVGEVKVSKEEFDKLSAAVKESNSQAAQLNAQQKGLASSLNLTATAIGLQSAIWNKATEVMFRAVDAVKEYIKEAALLNARHETMGIVMEVVGRNAGYTRDQMLAAAEGVRKMGITMLESRESVTKLVQANLDLSLATKLARAAQDAAVIANINSSQAFERMIYGIQSGQTEVLRTMGINVTFEESYKKLARQLNVTTEQLTEQEKTQARANVVLESSTKIVGAYEAAMGTAGKQINSLARYTEDLKTLRGEVFNEALVIAVNTYTDALKGATDQTKTLAEEKKLKEWGRDTVMVLAYLVDQLQAFKVVAVEIATPIERLARNIYTLGAAASIAFGPGSVAEKRAAMSQLTEESQAYYKALDDRLKANRGFRSAVSEANKFFNQRDLDETRKAQKELIEAFTGTGEAAAATGNTIRDAGKAGGEDMKQYVLSLKEAASITKESTIEEKVLFELREKHWKNATAALRAQAIEYAKAQDARRLEEVQKKGEADAAAVRVKIWADEQKAINDLRNDGFAEDARLLALGISGEKEAASARAEAAIAEMKAVNDGRNAAFDEETDSQKRRAKEFDGLWSTVESTGKSAFVHLMADGTSAFKSIGQSLKTAVIDLLYQLTARKWIINIGTSIAGSLGIQTAASAAAAAAGAGGDNTGAQLSSLSSLFSSFYGGASAAITGGVQSIGVALGSQFIADIGTGMAGSFAGAMASEGIAQSIGYAIPYIGWVMAAYSVYKAFFEGHDTVQGSGAAILSTSGTISTQAGELHGGYDPTSVTGLAAAAVTNLSKVVEQLGGTLSKVFTVGVGQGGGGEFNVTTDIGGVQLSDHASLDSAQAQLETVRAVMVGLQQAADFPAYITKLFASINAGTATAQQINDTIAFANAVKLVHGNLTETRPAFQILTDSAAELEAKLGTSAASFKTDFLAAIDAGITPEAMGNWQKLAGYIDAVNASVAGFTAKREGLASQFDSPERKLANAQGQVNEIFGRYNVPVPESAQQLADIFRMIPTDTAAGQALIAELEAMAPAFHLVFDAAKEGTPDLVDAAAGMREAQDSQFQMMMRFGSEADKYAAAQGIINAAAEKFGVTAPTTAAQFYDVIKSIDATTPAGQALIKELIGYADAMEIVADHTAQSAEQQRLAQETAINSQFSMMMRFGTEADKYAAAQNIINEAAAKFGVTAPTTAAQFYDVIKSIDATTPAGQALIKELSGYADAMDIVAQHTAAVADEAERAAKALQEQARAQQEATNNLLNQQSRSLAELLAQIYEEQGKAEAALITRRSEENRKIREIYGEKSPVEELTKQLWALQDAAAAAAKAAEQQAKAAQVMTDINSLWSTFATDAQKLAAAQSTVNKYLSDTGQTYLPSREEIASRFEALKTSPAFTSATVEQQQAFIASMKAVADAFDLVTRAAEAAAQKERDIQSQMFDVRIQMFEAQGQTEIALQLKRGKEIERLNQIDPTSRLADLTRQLWDLQDAAAAAAKETEAAAAAAAKAAEIAKSQRSLDIQLAEALGHSEEALAMTRADQLAALDESLRGTQQAIWNALDARKLEDATRQWTDTLQAWLKGNLLDETLSPLTAQQRFAEAQSQYVEDLLKAQGGDAAARANVTKDADNYLKEALAMYGRAGTDYNAIYRAIHDQIQGLVDQPLGKNGVPPGIPGGSPGPTLTVQDVLTSGQQTAKQQTDDLLKEIKRLNDKVDALTKKVSDGTDKQVAAVGEVVESIDRSSRDIPRNLSNIIPFPGARLI